MKLLRQLSERHNLFTSRHWLLWGVLLAMLVLYWSISGWQVVQLLQLKLQTLNSAQESNLLMLHQHSHQRLLFLREQLPRENAARWVHQQPKDSLHHQL